MAVTNIDLPRAKAETAAIARMVEEQLFILGNYASISAKMAGRWQGDAYLAYEELFQKVAPDSVRLLEQVQRMNNSVSALITQLENDDNRAATAFGSV